MEGDESSAAWPLPEVLEDGARLACLARRIDFPRGERPEDWVCAEVVELDMDGDGVTKETWEDVDDTWLDIGHEEALKTEESSTDGVEGIFGRRIRRDWMLQSTRCGQSRWAVAPEVRLLWRGRARVLIYFQNALIRPRDGVGGTDGRTGWGRLGVWFNGWDWGDRVWRRWTWCAGRWFVAVEFGVWQFGEIAGKRSGCGRTWWPEWWETWERGRCRELRNSESLGRELEKVVWEVRVGWRFGTSFTFSAPVEEAVEPSVGSRWAREDGGSSNGEGKTKDEERFFWGLKERGRDRAELARFEVGVLFGEPGCIGDEGAKAEGEGRSGGSSWAVVWDRGLARRWRYEGSVTWSWSCWDSWELSAGRGRCSFEGNSWDEVPGERRRRWHVNVCEEWARVHWKLGR